MDEYDKKVLAALVLAFLVVVAGCFITDYSIKQQRAGCIQTLKDRPAADILAVCK